MNVQEKIHNQVTSSQVVLYMKGKPMSPQCGFSGATVQLINACGVQDFTAVDVLADPEIRDGIKLYSNWPTVPQLYINGNFVGGADIVRELYEQGELQTMIQSALAG